MGPRNLLLAIVLGIAIAAGLFVATGLNVTTQSQSTLETALVLPAASLLPEFSLIDQDGNAATTNTFRGRWNLLFFGFTNCPDICPTTLQTLAAAQRELTKIGDSPVPRIVLVSVDPERDTPLRLRDYISHFGDDILGVTGTLPELQKLTSALGIYFARRPVDGESYSVDHSAAVLVINPDGEFHALFSAPHSTANFVNDLPKIMASYQPRLVATDVRVTEPAPGGRVSAGYLSLSNNTADVIRISDIVSPQFESVEIHESTLDNGVARMRRITELVIPAHATVTLHRGGMHLMLLRPTLSDDTISLRFFEGETLALNVDTSFARGDE